jgi:hypothetical protein
MVVVSRRAQSPPQDFGLKFTKYGILHTHLPSGQIGKGFVGVPSLYQSSFLLVNTLTVPTIPSL